MSLLAIALLLALPQDFNPTGDAERTQGDSWLTKASQWNPDPEPSLASVNMDAFRFSTMPPLRAGEAIIVTVAPGPRGDAIATIGIRRRVCFDDQRAECRIVSSRSARFAFCVDGDCNYRRFARRVHGLLFAAPIPRTTDAPVPCTDGPGYTTELRESGQTYNLYGFCGELHPNNPVYRLVRQGTGEYWPKTPYFD